MLSDGPNFRKTQDMLKKTLFQHFAFWARNVRSREMFNVMAKYCRGKVLDVGGRDFYHVAKEKGFKHDGWVTVEYTDEHVIKAEDSRCSVVLADGCRLGFKDNSFDTVLNIQVMEHVFEPIKMFEEIARVLKPGGHAVILVPQTGVLHESPHHYYNFTKFWLEKAAELTHTKVVLLKPMGGVFSTMASHMVYFFFQAARVKGYTPEDYKRSPMFFLLLPLMVLYAIVHIPVCLFLSLGDLAEGANNHLMVIRKPDQR